MWSRKVLKNRAKAALKGHYWEACLAVIFSFICHGPSLNINTAGVNATQPVNMSNGMTIAIAFMVILALSLAVGFRAFIGYPIDVGCRRYFVDLSMGVSDLNAFVYPFWKGKYLSIVKTMAWRDFLVFLWSLLFVFPGIVKLYSYSMVPYILAEDATIGREEAIILSAKMTSGYKYRMFILDMSFLGVAIAGCLCFFVGIIFVMPYIFATKAELYRRLKNDLKGEFHES